jgi:hypothetical protein
MTDQAVQITRTWINNNLCALSALARFHYAQAVKTPDVQTADDWQDMCERLEHMLKTIEEN